MKDTLETNLAANVAVESEQTNVIETPQEVAVTNLSTPEVVEENNVEVLFSSASDVVQYLTLKLAGSDEISRADIEALKQSYYKLKRNAVDEEKKTFVAEGGDEANFVPSPDSLEDEFKALLSQYKEKRAKYLEQEEALKSENYAKKLKLIDQLKELTESKDEFQKLYNEFKEIQHAWKEIKLVPQEHANELWNNYQIYSEKFYDIVKINNQFRDYDFKKNLDIKLALCDAVEKLQIEHDVISAFHQLQKLHQQWREAGPVAREKREEIWIRFKTASTLINKRHQEHFEKQKEKEVDNLEKKTLLCEKIEALDYSEVASLKQWDEITKSVIEMQEAWKKIGFAPKKNNTKIYERFRKACDDFFEKKGAFYRSLREQYTVNLEKKKQLCEKAEQLKDSQEWRETTDKMIALQKEWKTIGSVPRKHADSIWKRFVTACDYFFEQKKQSTSSQKGVESNNLEAKKSIIAKIDTLDESLSVDDALVLLKGYASEFNAVGHVPFKNKDVIYKDFHRAIDAQYDRLKINQKERRMEAFKSNLAGMSHDGSGKGQIYSEREKQMRIYERMKVELQTYENNIGFLSISSKGGSGLVKDMERKIERLKEDIELTLNKINMIDANLE